MPRVRLIALIALLFAWAGAPALADEAAEQAAFEQVEALIGERRFDDARAILAQTPRDSEYARVYGAFVEARIDEETGRLPAARDAYRAILDGRPGLARVRLHLARTLSKLEDAEGARRHYEFVLGAPEIAGPLADRVRADMRQLDGARSWSAQGYVTIAPTTNMTSGASQDVVVIGGLPFTPTESARRKPGVGALYGADFGYASPLSENWGWLATLSTSHRDYTGGFYDERTARASAGLRYLLQRGVATFELAGSRRWFGGDEYQYAFGSLVTTRFYASDRDRITASASFLQQRYDDATYQNGHRIAVSATWDRFTLPGQFLRIGATFERETARSDHLAFNEVGALAGYNFEMPMSLIVYPEAAWAWRAYDGDFPLMGAPRRDRRFVGSLALVKTDFAVMGLAPRLQVSYTLNLSNVKFYEYDRFDVALTMTRGF